VKIQKQPMSTAGERTATSTPTGCLVAIERDNWNHPKAGRATVVNKTG
jgi:hypothetical protein